MQNLPAFGQVSLGQLKLILSGPGHRFARPAGWTFAGARRVESHRPSCPDLPTRIEELQKAGVRFRNKLEVGPGGKQIQIEDPDGNPIEYSSPPTSSGDSGIPGTAGFLVRQQKVAII